MMGSERGEEDELRTRSGFPETNIRVLIHAPVIRNWVHDERGGTPFFLL